VASVCTTPADGTGGTAEGLVDWTVDGDDLQGLVGDWATASQTWDLDNDGLVGVVDLLTLLAGWGMCQ